MIADLTPILARRQRIIQQVKEHAGRAAAALIEGDYSFAATEAHRAHQKELTVRELDWVVALDG